MEVARGISVAVPSGGTAVLGPGAAGPAELIAVPGRSRRVRRHQLEDIAAVAPAVSRAVQETVEQAGLSRLVESR